MTMPNERYNSILAARELLTDILASNEALPQSLRDRANGVLRHFPDPSTVRQMARHVPRLLESPEPAQKDADSATPSREEAMRIARSVGLVDEHGRLTEIFRCDE